MLEVNEANRAARKGRNFTGLKMILPPENSLGDQAQAVLHAGLT